MIAPTAQIMRAPAKGAQMTGISVEHSLDLAIGPCKIADIGKLRSDLEPRAGMVGKDFDRGLEMNERSGAVAGLPRKFAESKQSRKGGWRGGAHLLRQRLG